MTVLEAGCHSPFDRRMAAIRDFMARGVVVRTVINGMAFDGATTDPVQMAVRDSLIAFMAATAQAQAEATSRVHRANDC